MNHLMKMILLSGLAGICLAAGPGPGVSAVEALIRLQRGNERFVSGNLEHPDLSPARIRENAKKGQFPFATVLGCSDSRVPVEIVFDQGVGSLFVIRVAGNVSDVDETGSMEYGFGHLKTPLVVVLGHTSCGAVTAVAQEAKVGGSIPALVDNIVPAVRKVKATESGPVAKWINKAVQANVWQSIEELLKRSGEARHKVMGGSLSIVGAMYHLDSGKVEFFGEHPEQARILSAYQGSESKH